MKILVLVFVLLISSFSSAVNKKHPFAPTREPKKYIGDTDYTPTKLEWLTTQFYNECGFWFGSIDTVSWGLFNPLSKKDTIELTVRYDNPKVLPKIKIAANTCKRNMKALAKARGWTWLKIKEDISIRNVSSQ